MLQYQLPALWFLSQLLLNLLDKSKLNVSCIIHVAILAASFTPDFITSGSSISTLTGLMASLVTPAVDFGIINMDYPFTLIVSVAIVDPNFIASVD